jgi:hypothetical protein
MTTKQMIEQQPHSPLFRRSCGCIGMALGGTWYLLIDACDASFDEPVPQFWGRRQFHPDEDEEPRHTYEWLTEDEAEKHLGTIARYVHRGHEMTKLASFIGHVLDLSSMEQRIIDAVKQSAR